MTGQDQQPPLLNYATKDTLPVARPWYVIIAGIIFCLPVIIPGFFCLRLIVSIAHQWNPIDDLAWMILSGGLCAVPVVFAYRAIVRRSRRAAVVLCWLAAVPAGLFTTTTFFAVTTSPMPARYRLWSGIAMGVAFFVVMSVKRWCNMLNRINPARPSRNQREDRYPQIPTDSHRFESRNL